MSIFNSFFSFSSGKNLPEQAKIKVIGVGGAGSNALLYMVSNHIDNVEFWAVNTDAQALNTLPSNVKICQIGSKITRGLGTGMNPALGEQAAKDDLTDLDRITNDCDMVFITAGMGGGTGTGAAPEIAKIAKSKGVLTVGIVTKPFNDEGIEKRTIADEGISLMRDYCDAVIIVPNQKLFDFLDENITFADALAESNKVLYTATRSVADIIQSTGDINVDFADIKSIMTDSGSAFIGIGEGETIEQAINQAITSPLLEHQFKGAKGIIYSVQSSRSLSLGDIKKTTETIKHYADSSAKIKMGNTVNNELGNKVIITLIATNLTTENRGGFKEGAGRPKKNA